MRRPLAASALAFAPLLIAPPFDLVAAPAHAAWVAGPIADRAASWAPDGADTAWEKPKIVGLLNSCLRTRGNMKEGVTADWPKESVDLAAEEVPARDVLQGVTQRAMITLEVPIRSTGNRSWTLARECFDYERANLFSTVTPETGVFACQPKHVAIWGLVDPRSAEWPCRSRG